MKNYKQMKTQVQSQSGFTFIEILVAITILSFGILGLVTTTHSVNVNQKNADDTTEATMIATDHLERIKRFSTNEPLGGIFGFEYFIDDQVGGFLEDYAKTDDYTREISETSATPSRPDLPPPGFTRVTTVEVYPAAAQATEDFTMPGTIHMVNVRVDVSWVNAGGATKNIVLNTILQRRQFIQ